MNEFTKIFVMAGSAKQFKTWMRNNVRYVTSVDQIVGTKNFVIIKVGYHWENPIAGDVCDCGKNVMETTCYVCGKEQCYDCSKSDKIHWYCKECGPKTLFERIYLWLKNFCIQ